MNSDCRFEALGSVTVHVSAPSMIQRRVVLTTNNGGSVDRPANFEEQSVCTRGNREEAPVLCNVRERERARARGSWRESERKEREENYN